MFPRGLVLAVVSALLVRLSFPPYDLAPFALVGWAPLLVLVGQQRPVALFGWAYLQSLLLNLVVHWWLVPGLNHATGTSVWGACGALGLVALVQALRTPLALLAVQWTCHHHCPIWVSFPIAAAAAEMLCPHLFPWTMALQVHSVGPWLQLASLAGASTVTLWVALVNALLALAWQRRKQTGPAVGALVAAGAALCAVTIHGVWVSALQEERERVAPSGRVVLGHVFTMDGSRERDRVPQLRAATTAALNDAAPPDFILWPETVLSRPIDPGELQRAARDYLLRDRARGARARVIRAPLLFGAVLKQRGRLYNSAVLVNTEGTLVSRYDKQGLVPVGESSQLASWLPELESWLPTVTSFTPGENKRRFHVAEHALAVSICYEDILPQSFRAAVLDAAPELLVNLTSDAWFAGTDAVDFHLALAKLRSVEHRRYLVRSTRDGASVVIDSLGRIIVSLDRSRTNAAEVEVRWLSGMPLYTRYGNRALWMILLLEVVLAVALRKMVGRVSYG